MTLTGYTTPQTATGRSALVPPPPWYFAGDVLMVEFRADPERVRELVPLRLDLPSDPGWCAAIFGEWQSCTAGGEELLDPCRSQYREFYVAIACELDGRPVARCPYCWVDRDFSLVRGLIQGYPKKLGSIWITRPMTVGAAGPRLDSGARLGATMSASDRRLVEMDVTLERRGDGPPSLFTAPLIHTRVFPAWDTAGGAPPVDELVTGGSADQEASDVWVGSGRLSLLPSAVDELSQLSPVEMGSAYRFSYAETLLGGNAITDR